MPFTLNTACLDRPIVKDTQTKTILPYVLLSTKQFKPLGIITDVAYIRVSN